MVPFKTQEPKRKIEDVESADHHETVGTDSEGEELEVHTPPPKRQQRIKTPVVISESESEDALSIQSSYHQTEEAEEINENQG